MSKRSHGYHLTVYEEMLDESKIDNEKLKAHQE
jgi:hypothetical protein